MAAPSAAVTPRPAVHAVPSRLLDSHEQANLMAFHANNYVPTTASHVKNTQNQCKQFSFDKQ